MLALACAVPLAGCGSDGDRPPQGPAAARVGQEAVDTLFTVERARASLVAAVDLYGLGGPERAESRSDALAHLAAASRLYDTLADRVRAADPVLDRELRYALRTARSDIEGRRRFDIVRDRLGPVRAQLLDGVYEALVERDAREDPGLRAQVLIETLDALQREYESGATIAGGASRRSKGLAYGLLARSQAQLSAINDAMGDEHDDAVLALSRLRDEVWPDGISPPADAPLQVVTAASRDVREAVVGRFGF